MNQLTTVWNNKRISILLLAAALLLVLDLSAQARKASIVEEHRQEAAPQFNGGSGVIYVSSNSDGSIGDLKFSDEDILEFDSSSGGWSMFFDGSDVGLSGSSYRNIDAFHFLEDGSILFSLAGDTNVPDIGAVDDSDIIHFKAASLGNKTAGNFTLYFDGSDVGLTTSGEDIDALTLMANGDLVVSTTGNATVGNLRVKDEDLLRFSPDSKRMGTNTMGSWELYFDGSDIGLADSASEDVWGVWVDGANGLVYLTTQSTFLISGASGDGADIFQCQPAALGVLTGCLPRMVWDGSVNGIAGEHVDGIMLQMAEGGVRPTKTPVPAKSTPTRTAVPSTSTPPAPGELQISQITDNSGDYANSHVPTYEKFEITFQIDNTVAGNFQLPYDADPPTGIDPDKYPKHKGVSVNAYFLPPGENNWNAAYAQPGFFYRDYDYQTRDGMDWIYPTQADSWKVRFAPHKAGRWQYKLKVQDESGVFETLPASFIASASNNKGFVKVSESDPRYFEYDDGSYFPGLGRQGISWFNYPTIENAQEYADYGNNDVKLVRAWMSGFYGTAWLEWVGTRDLYDGYLPRSGTEAFRDPVTNQDYLTMVLEYWSGNDDGWYDACRIGRPNVQESVKQYTDYILSITYWGEGITGPRNKNYDKYGLVGKIGPWTNDCQDADNIPVITTHGQSTTNWTTLQGTWNSGSNNFLPKLHIALENVAQGRALVREISLREDLGGGQLGPEILTEPSLEYELYFPERSALQIDQAIDLARESDIYLKLVLMDKNDKVWFKLDDDGSFVIGGEPDNEDGFYGDWRQVNKTRWLQQAYFRYVQARWGYSTHVHSWELTNEGDPYNRNHWALADEMGKDFHCRIFGRPVGYQSDQECMYDHPNDHLVTTSFWHSFPVEEFWANPDYPNIDYADFHAYISTGWLPDPTYEGDSALFHWDYAADTRSGTDWYADQNGMPTKPVVRGETGIDFVDTQTENPDLLKDINGVWLHNLTWAGLGPEAVIELYWWRETIDTSPGPDGQPGLHEVYKYHFDFIEDIPLNNGNYVDAEALLTDTGLRSAGQKDLVNNRAHVWIQNGNHTWSDVVGGSAQTGLIGKVSVSGFSPNVTLPIEWHQFTTLGVPKIVSGSATSDPSGKLTLNLPSDPSISDAAVKIGSY